MGCGSAMPIRARRRAMPSSVIVPELIVPWLRPRSLHDGSLNGGSRYSIRHSTGAAEGHRRGAEVIRTDDLIMVSVDDHLVEPPDMFASTIPSRWRDRAPRVVRQEDGADVWTFEG